MAGVVVEMTGDEAQLFRAIGQSLQAANLDEKSASCIHSK